MRLEGEQTLLRIYLRNTDKQGWFAPPAAESLVQRARRDGLAGATVLRGLLGLDITGRLLESSPWSLVDHVPVLVEIVDGPQAVGRFLAVVEQMVPEGMATLERAHVILSRLSAVVRWGRPEPSSAMKSISPLISISICTTIFFVGYSKLFAGEFIHRTAGPQTGPSLFYVQYSFKW